MVLVELLNAMGAGLQVRNLMVDYCDLMGNHFHKPLQTIHPAGLHESDFELVARIKTELNKKGYRVTGIHEVTGTYEMRELERIFNSSECRKHPVRTIFYDPGKAAEHCCRL